MNHLSARVILIALVALPGLIGLCAPSRAETGSVAVIFTKGGFIVGVGGGEGVLIFRGERYPFTVSGMSVGATIGASTTEFTGRALNLKGPGSIEGNYSALGGRWSARRWRWGRSVTEHQRRDLAAQRSEGRP
jgi:hypothetical protein